MWSRSMIVGGVPLLAAAWQVALSAGMPWPTRVALTGVGPLIWITFGLVLLLCWRLISARQAARLQQLHKDLDGRGPLSSALWAGVAPADLLRPCQTYPGFVAMSALERVAGHGDPELFFQLCTAIPVWDSIFAPGLPEHKYAASPPHHTLLHMAAHSGSEDIVRWLLQHEVSWARGLSWKQLRDYQPLVARRDHMDELPLFVACRQNRLAMFKLLYRAHPVTDATTLNRLLNLAALNHADPIAVCLDRSTDLRWSAARAQPRRLVEMLDALLARKVMLDQTDHDGQTALNTACRHGHRDLVLRLLAAGARCDSGARLDLDWAINNCVQEARVGWTLRCRAPQDMEAAAHVLVQLINARAHISDALRKTCTRALLNNAYPAPHAAFMIAMGLLGPHERRVLRDHREAFLHTALASLLRPRVAARRRLTLDQLAKAAAAEVRSWTLAGLEEFASTHHHLVQGLGLLAQPLPALSAVTRSGITALLGMINDACDSLPSLQQAAAWSWRAGHLEQLQHRESMPNLLTLARELPIPSAIKCGLSLDDQGALLTCSAVLHGVASRPMAAV
ncbi:uncharacterized protein MONBRDRAFT_36576 [Monosiga brevicollis MX1]|uniref:Ankyrin repeat domain-containing protein n=1 Tax=Monosiga brevicollis TaxID=81824 RepID=A9UW62_MONBE|nr:uncharacterized protein MONBRDRAFT_36576 [Monosiga brevicollis MX1]EDQ90506.1 predicted protein [Monosiga brevicollis MX1]|eukprot:XP_001744557.1 hypothetical protein [Monosiga brevicollis MX1]